MGGLLVGHLEIICWMRWALSLDELRDERLLVGPLTSVTPSTHLDMEFFKSTRQKLLDSKWYLKLI
jgi:hypothetical protein